jgi:hypothetical protein
MRWPSLYYRATVQLGYGHDEPFKTIQDKLHEWSGRMPVPRGEQRNGAKDVVIDFEVDRWGWIGTAFQHFVGAGGWVGTPSQEVYVHAGFNQPPWRPGGPSPFVTVAALVRAGLQFPGDAFPDEGLSDWYRSIEGAVRFPAGKPAVAAEPAPLSPTFPAPDGRPAGSRVCAPPQPSPRCAVELDSRAPRSQRFRPHG